MSANALAIPRRRRRRRRRPRGREWYPVMWCALAVACAVGSALDAEPVYPIIFALLAYLWWSDRLWQWLAEGTPPLWGPYGAQTILYRWIVGEPEP